jgi:hypothetical protein
MNIWIYKYKFQAKIQDGTNLVINPLTVCKYLSDWKIMFNLVEDCLLGCRTVQCGRNWLTFQRCLLPPSSGPDDGGSKHPRNNGHFLQDYTTQHTRIQSPSYLSPWEPEISPIFKLINKHILKVSYSCSEILL